MKELRFHKAIYPASAVDEAVRVFSPHAQIDRREEGEEWIVEVTAKAPARERRVAGELGNYALGLSLRDKVGG